MSFGLLDVSGQPTLYTMMGSHWALLPALLIVPILSETRFFAQGHDTRVVFVVDAERAGQVAGLNPEMKGLVLPARKVK